MDEAFGWVAALCQVFVAPRQQGQHSNLGSGVPRALWDTGAASMSQLDPEALVRSLLGWDTHEEPPPVTPHCGPAGPLPLTITQLSCSALW